MTRAILACATVLTLMLNGSMAVAQPPAPAQVAACANTQICQVSLRMLSAPPARPADLRVVLTLQD